VAEKRKKPDPAWFDFDGLTPDEVEELRAVLLWGRKAAIAAASMHEFEGSPDAAKSWRKCALEMLRFQRRVGLAHKGRP
jgi:hypothetical protein